eukprot:TRINITY_DN5464_c0_g1_i5.p1 TRINITY_DN5464_c0_g1~~TRINITY_DN5464_c0_g1_i5.p1  ORF type:complete len:278 (+),score=63.27 TRINITY_DN5464_c0_g1_i5:80-913(+)
MSQTADIDFTYPDENMEMWETLWGKDFISPGGADEVREIVSKEDLQGKAILEVGSGWGGPAFQFVKEFRAAKVVGIEFQKKCVEKATRRAVELGVSDKVEFIQVSSVRWEFPDESFDIVFSKDAILHTEDKETLFLEAMRVLKPGGRFIVADWFGSDLPPNEDLNRFKADNEFSIFLSSLGQTVDLLIRLGFARIRVEDRCDWFHQMFQRDVETLKGEKGVALMGSIGAEKFKDLLRKWFEPCVVLAKQGHLRLGTFYASKPTGIPTPSAGTQSVGS